MTKVVGSGDKLQYFKDGQTIMHGGFMGVGTPAGTVRELLAHGAKDLTIIGNDTAFPETGVGPLIGREGKNGGLPWTLDIRKELKDSIG